MKITINKLDKPSGFVDIPGFEGKYAISKNGHVYSYPKKTSKNTYGKILKNSLNDSGYYCVNLYLTNNYFKRKRIHRLIAQAFIPNPENKPFINHKNSIRHDNRIENLEWCSMEENMRFSKKKHGHSTSKYKGITLSKATGKWIAQINMNKKGIFIGSFLSEKEAAKAYDKKAKELFGNFALTNNL